MYNISIKQVETQSELNECLKIRSTVFIDEMSVPRDIEVDDYDCICDTCSHFLVTVGDTPAGTVRCRICDDGRVKMQRLCFLPEYRGNGLGRKTLEFLESRYCGLRGMYMDAKHKAVGFYKSCGYSEQSEPFYEADVLHVTMSKAFPSGIVTRLFDMRDTVYRDFQCRLMPNIQPQRVMGVRIPDIRAYAKQLSGSTEASSFMDSLPHTYYDENNLHSCLIEKIKDYDEAIMRVESFLPYVDNWATCDIMTPRVFSKHLQELLDRIRVWLTSKHTYTVRFGIEMLMNFYLDDNYLPQYTEMVVAVKSDEYYINMIRAWYIATALAKHYTAVIPYIENRRMDVWTHNKSIQKAIESRRITDEQKTYLRTLKIR